MSDVPETPWDSHVSRLMRDEGLSLSAARDRVIVDWLSQGNTSALAALLLDGHEPGEFARTALALMLLDETEAKKTIEQRPFLDPELWLFPYRLVAKGKPRSGRPPDPINAERDRLLAENVHELMQKHGLKYDSAIEQVAASCRETGAAVGHQTIRNAYDRRFGKKSRT
jgi:hypothetical protein